MKGLMTGVRVLTKGPTLFFGGIVLFAKIFGALRGVL
jgi:hypothetical protein